MDKAMNRQRVLLQHLRPNSSVSSSNYESAALSASICAAGDSAAYHRTAAFGDDVVIVAAYQTAICKAKRGGFKDTLPDDLLAPVLKEVIVRTNLNPSEVGDIDVGTVMAPGSLRATECRMQHFTLPSRGLGALEDAHPDFFTPSGDGNPGIPTCPGARCVATLLNEMKRCGTDHRFDVISMCMGMGAAAVFERGDSVDELCNA